MQSNSALRFTNSALRFTNDDAGGVEKSCTRILSIDESQLVNQESIRKFAEIW